MRELSLFTGAGGGLLGTTLLGWTHIGYVEINEYCQRVIAQRIKDGLLDEAPIFTDINEFTQSGAADQYRGIADVVTGGFPCQDISSAGNGKGIYGEKSRLWFKMFEVIKDVRPQYVFLENSSLLISRGLALVVSQLADLGYSSAWGVIGAKEAKFPQSRKRLYLVADSMPRNAKVGGDLSGSWGEPEQVEKFLVGPTESEPPMVGVANGLAHRVDRLRAIGNGQVPQVVATAWKILTAELGRA